MLTAIEIENFKAFGDKQRIELRPLTLLFGPNSGGKSSILHALHYAREIMLGRGVDVHTTESGAEMVDLGGLDRLVHGRVSRASSPELKLTFELDLTKEILDDWPTDSFGENDTEIRDDVHSAINAVETAAITLRIHPTIPWYLVGYEVVINRVPFASLITEKGKTQIDAVNRFHPIFLTSAFFQSNFPTQARAGSCKKWLAGLFEPIPELIQAIQDAPTSARQEEAYKSHHGWWIERLTAWQAYLDSDYTWDIKNRDTCRQAIVEYENRFGDAVNTDEIHRDLVQFIRDHLDNSRDYQDIANAMFHMSYIEASVVILAGESIGPDSHYKWKAPISNCNKGLPDLERGIELEKELTNPFYRDLEFLLSSLIAGPGRVLRDELQKLRYVGPLRIIPPRILDQPDPVGYSNWPNGLAAWLRLQSADQTLSDLFNKWLEHSDLLDTGYRIRVDSGQLMRYQTLFEKLADGRPEEIDHQAPPRAIELNSSVHTLITLEDIARGIFVQACDVGVGISQVIPILVSVLDREARIVAMEQPELHLHPRQQAALGDLMIEGALGEEDDENRLLIIETHSEHLILRLLRRMRETNTAVKPPEFALTPNDIRILYVSPEDSQSSKVRIMHVDVNGDFVDPWPDDFFEQGYKERFA